MSILIWWSCILQNRGVYMFRIDSDVVVDATMAGGPARYINHSCDPNCVAEVVPFDKESKIIIITNRRIPKGEEVCSFIVTEIKCCFLMENNSWLLFPSNLISKDESIPLHSLISSFPSFSSKEMFQTWSKHLENESVGGGGFFVVFFYRWGLSSLSNTFISLTNIIFPWEQKIQVIYNFQPYLVFNSSDQ